MKPERISMGDVARAAGVSKNTVSLALRNDPQIPERTCRRIARIAAKLGYRKNAVVGQLMAELRRSRAPRFEFTLALLNANQDSQAFRRHPTIPVYVAGCRRRASELGYATDEIWLHDEDLDGARLNQIFQARNIRGAVIVGLMRENRLPERFRATWEMYPCVVAGVRTRDPALSFACTDHYILALSAFRQALRLGYKRPALVLDEAIDRLVEGRFSAGFIFAQQDVPPADRAAPFYKVRAARQEFSLFQQWFERERPDVILTLYNVVRYWVEELGLAVPDDIGLIQMEWRAESPDWAGMDQHNDVAGMAAIEMLISMIHNREAGPPAFPRATLIGSSWVDGKTVSARA